MGSARQCCHTNTGSMAGRYYANRLRMSTSASTDPSFFPSQYSTYSSARAKSEFNSDTSYRYGLPEYRTTNIEIRHATPVRTDLGDYVPRTTKRAISVTTLDARNSVPVRLYGEEGERGRILSDTRYSYPSTARCLSVTRASTPRRHISRFSDTSRGVSINRFESSGPVRYSQLPRFQSRFYRWDTERYVHCCAQAEVLPPHLWILYTRRSTPTTFMYTVEVLLPHLCTLYTRRSTLYMGTSRRTPTILMHRWKYSHHIYVHCTRVEVLLPHLYALKTLEVLLPF